MEKELERLGAKITELRIEVTAKADAAELNVLLDKTEESQIRYDLLENLQHSLEDAEATVEMLLEI